MWSGSWRNAESGSTMREPSSPVEPPSRIPWPPLLLVLSGFAAWWLGRLVPLQWPGQGDLAAQIVGLGNGVAGILLLAWSALTLWRGRTTVRPDRAASALVVDGPYRFRRNPIYIADALILLGIAEVTRNVWFAIAVVPFLILVTLLAILPEERHLEARFGDEWRDYKARVRRLL